MKQQHVTRRHFLKILALSAAGAAAYQFGIRPQLAGLKEITASRLLMGTVVNLTVVGEDEDAARTAVTTTLEQMSHLETILSRHQTTSQLSLLNQNGVVDRPSSHLVAVLQQAQEISALSDGAFDVTVKPLLDLYRNVRSQNDLPSQTAVTAALSLVNYRNLDISGSQIAFTLPGMAITVDGIGKGYIVDQGTATLHEQGFRNVLVEAGGDLLASGRKNPGSAWQIGIQSPRQIGKKMLASFAVEDQAVATSGDYMQPYTADFRHHHILDPRIGYSVHDLASATVLAPAAMLADGLATAVMAMPVHDAAALLEETAGCEGYLVTKKTESIQTSGFTARQAT